MGFLGACHSPGIQTPEASVYKLIDRHLVGCLSLPVAGTIPEPTMKMETGRAEDRHNLRHSALELGMSFLDSLCLTWEVPDIHSHTSSGQGLGL